VAKKLYRVDVSIEFDMYVVAEDAAEAEEIAQSRYKDELDEGVIDASLSVKRVTSPKQVSAEGRESLPWDTAYGRSSGPDKTVQEYLDELPPVDRTKPLFPHF